MKTTILDFLRVFFRREPMLFVLSVVFIPLIIALPEHIPQVYFYIDWKTILSLTCLLLIALGIKESGFLDIFAASILRRIHSERSLAVFFVLFSAALSTFLTNDIALFIVVPLTLSIQRSVKNSLARLVIFEALAVNAGSALTPIGNPQNLFLWNAWGNSFAEFTLTMLPLVSLLLLLLLGFTLFSFPKTPLSLSSGSTISLKKNVAKISFGLLLLFILAMQFHKEILILPAVIFTFFVAERRVLRQFDWLLILTFMLMFVNFHIISSMDIVLALTKVAGVDSSPKATFLTSALLSQGMSNVPAAVFMANFSHDWRAIAFGVSVGGFGFVVGSLANIIALRLAHDLRLLADFHRVSFVYFLLSAAISTFIFFL